MEALEKTHTLDVHWRSFELRPEGTVVPEWYRQQIMASRPRFATMMWETFGIEIQPGPWGINSRKALIGAKVAEAAGDTIGERYHRETLDAYWTEGRDISDLAVLKAIAADAGMDQDVFAARLDEPEYHMQVGFDIELAYRVGIRGVPALLLEKKYLLSGYQPPDALAEILAELPEASHEE